MPVRVTPQSPGGPADARGPSRLVVGRVCSAGLGEGRPRVSDLGEWWVGWREPRGRGRGPPGLFVPGEVGGGVSYNNLDQTVNHGMALVMTPGARLLLPLLDSPEEKFA